MGGGIINILNSVVTIGPDFVRPRGGIAQVIYNYRRYVFGPKSFFVANSCEGSKLKKLLLAGRAALRLILLLLTKHNVKIVHIHTASRNSFRRSCIYLNIAKALGRKVVMHIHGGSFKEYYHANSEYVKHQLHKCDQIVVLSTYWKNFIMDELKLDNVSVINNIIPMPSSINGRRNEEILHALFMGVYVKEKGIYDLIKSLGSIKEKLKGKLLLHICGSGDVVELQKLIKTNGIDNMIKIDGWVDGEIKSELMNKCRLLILPSYIEGLPLSILEGMSYKMAILSTNVGGIPELLHGTENLIISPGNVEELSRAILHFATLSSDKLNLIGEKNHDIVKCYMPQAVKRSLVELYSKIA